MGEKRLEENVVIATEKIKEVDKKKSPQQPTNIPVQGKPLEENNNISSIKVEAGNHNNVVFRPNRQKVTSDKADTKVQNGTRKLTALPKEDETKIPNGASRVKEETVKLEDNAIVEEIRDSVKDVRDILDRLSKNEEVESKKEEVEQAEKSVECPLVLKSSQKKEQNMENSAEVPFLLNETGVDNIADLDFDKVKEHLLHINKTDKKKILVRSQIDKKILILGGRRASSVENYRKRRRQQSCQEARWKRQSCQQKARWIRWRISQVRVVGKDQLGKTQQLLMTEPRHRRL